MSESDGFTQLDDLEAGVPADFSELDDPAFLDERARMRQRLEHVPENAIGRAALERLYAAMTEEFLRRARAAWSTAS